MSSSTTPETVRPVTAISPPVVLGWLDEVRAAVRSKPWSSLIEFDGIDALDALLLPMYMNVLNAVRRGPEAEKDPASKAVLNEVRNLGYRIKVACLERMVGWRSAAPRPSDIVLWTRDVTHSVTLVPVAQELNRRSISNSLMACQPKVFNGISARGAGAAYTMGVWARVVRRARRDGARRARELAATGPWNLPAFPPAPLPTIEPTVRQTVIDFLPAVAESVANARMALDRFQPKLLVVGNDITMEGRVGCRLAGGRGVPVATFMHGNIAGNEFLSMHCADRLLVHGDIQRQELAEQGVPLERIVVCGAPSLDDRPQQSRKVHPLLQKRLGIRPDEPWILVATSGPGHRTSHRHHRIVIENLKRLSLALPTVPIVVKLHRKDRLEYYLDALRDCDGTRLVVVAEDAYGFPQTIFDWLQGCSLVLTGGSTAAVDAMLMDVPVISMDFCDEIHEADFINVGATAHVTSIEALEATVRDLLVAGKHRPEVQASVQTYLKAAFHAVDGNSSARGVAALLDLMAKGN